MVLEVVLVVLEVVLVLLEVTGPRTAWAPQSLGSLRASLIGGFNAKLLARKTVKRNTDFQIR